MVWYIRPIVFGDAAIIGGLIGLQIVYAGNSVLMSYLMSIGITAFTIIVFSALATFLVLSPFAVYFERKNWPEKWRLKLILQLVLIAFAGVTLFQSLFLKGIKLTSPGMATAMPNLAPGLIFIIAWTFRLEKVKLSCFYGKVKILGTLLCVVGALTMSLMHSAASVEEAKQASHYIDSPDNTTFDREKIIGSMYLLAAVFVLSSNVVLQATTLGDFPAPMSLCAITSLIGVFITAAVQLLQNQKLDFGWQYLGLADTMGYSLLAGTISGVCVSFNGWAMKKRGPVLVSMFSPIGTVITVILSVITLGDAIDIGSLAGMFLMFSGLYFVLWAKGKEGYSNGFESHEVDAEKPLLS
ncbi:WAT1-related protein [Melia azedarach]|uniref:WAT1-related protein n=1 Tax=Melia azedarach TaxID=155640 RepID=A0ACC1XPB2_MELAZ|nr:WAT1-related protein [Melia azedarach]